MHKKRPDIDIVFDLLKETLITYPTSAFIESLLYQYQERGSLSKKQLEGLYHKAASIKTTSPGKLATLEAIILKKPTKYKSPIPVALPSIPKDTLTGDRIAAILQKYPQHKRVLFYNVKYNNNQDFSSAEKAELEKFYKFLINPASK